MGVLQGWKDVKLSDERHDTQSQTRDGMHWSRIYSLDGAARLYDSS